MEFEAFPKIARLSRERVISEKIDGTNASILITESGEFFTGSRTRWITPDDDNFGFSRWAHEHKDELMGLGVGHHFGEWWGAGIQRNYGQPTKKFSLFNTSRWDPTNVPSCCHIVPVISSGPFGSWIIDGAMNFLKDHGSLAALGFMKPEGIVVYHTAARIYFKKTLEKDDEWKGKSAK